MGLDREVMRRLGPLSVLGPGSFAWAASQGGPPPTVADDCQPSQLLFILSDFLFPKVSSKVPGWSLIDSGHLSQGRGDAPL